MEYNPESFARVRKKVFFADFYVLKKAKFENFLGDASLYQC